MAAPRFLPKSVTLALRYGISLAVLGWFAWRVEWGDFAVFASFDWSLLWPAIALAAAAYPLQAWRWQILLRAQGIVPPARWVHRAFWVGHFFNMFLPGGIAGDAVRFASLWRIAPDRKAGAAASLLADRLLGLGTLCVLAIIGLGGRLLIHGGGERLVALLAVTSVVAVAIAVFFAALASGPRRNALAQRLIGPERAEALDAAISAFAQARGALGAATALSVLIWLVDFCSLGLLARSIGLEVTWLEISVAAAAAYAAAALPISIGGAGVREAVLIGVLALLGIGNGDAASTNALALAFWAINTGSGVVGGIVYAISIVKGFFAPASTSASAR